MYTGCTTVAQRISAPPIPNLPTANELSVPEVVILGREVIEAAAAPVTALVRSQRITAEELSAFQLFQWVKEDLPIPAVLPRLPDRTPERLSQILL